MLLVRDLDPREPNQCKMRILIQSNVMTFQMSYFPVEPATQSHHLPREQTSAFRNQTHAKTHLKKHRSNLCLYLNIVVFRNWAGRRFYNYLFYGQTALSKCTPPALFCSSYLSMVQLSKFKAGRNL
jgi:hypothetical protein